MKGNKLMVAHDYIPAGSYIVKVTGNCNLYCPYCYHFNGRDRIPQSTLPLDLLKSFIRQAAAYSPEKVWFTWHGGEPLIAGREYFQRAIDIERRVEADTGTQFRNTLQTNGTLITKEWADFFKANDIGVGVSLDGPRDIHDKNRVYFSGKGSFEQPLKGIRLLQGAGHRVGTLAVATKFSLGREREIFDFFLRNSITSFDFLPCMEISLVSGDVLPISITDREYAEFMITMFDIWTERDDHSIRIRYFENVMTGLLGALPRACTFNGTCGKYVTLDNDGAVLPCDNFVCFDEFVFGNLNDSTLSKILNSPGRRAFFEGASIARNECQGCEFFKACYGACRKYSYIFRKSLIDASFFCGSRKAIFGHAAAYVQKNLRGFEMPRRPGIFPVSELEFTVGGDNVTKRTAQN